MSQQTPALVQNQTKQQLLTITRQKLQKMYQDKKQTPSLIIPKNLPTFVKSQSYTNFVYLIFKYCKQFNQLIIKYEELKQKMKQRVNDFALFLQKQKLTITSLQKQLSYIYASILLMNNEGGSSGKDQKQQFFFQTLIYLITKVLKEMFTRQEFIPIQQEINRLFRTNRFNLIKRRHQKDTLMKQFPSLKEPNNKQKLTLQTMINKIPEQLSAYKKIEKMNRNRTASKSEYSYSTLMGVQEIKDQQQRSPLICTWLPSRKNMLNQFSRSKYKNHLKMSSGVTDRQRKTKILTHVYQRSINNFQ